MTVYRVTKAAYAETAFRGARGRGRWHRAGTPVVYCADTPATALLETLVHAARTDLLHQPYVVFAVGFDAERHLLRLAPDLLPDDWQAWPWPPSTQEVGAFWYEAQASLVLQVPSAVLPLQHNYLLNPHHPRFGELQVIRRAGSEEFQRTQLSEITLTVWDESEVSQTAAMARKLLLETHPGGKDFEIQVPLELLHQAEREKRIWNIVLGSIAGISLLVGGIGIMNIMLATITERTREIGIRRALGAKRKDITLQFLVETMVLSSTGGVLGILVGMAIPIAVGATVGLETSLSWWGIAGAFIVSVGIGVIFGLYPALRAAQMDPIEALRHE